jgi:hypothetical protein
VKSYLLKQHNVEKRFIVLCRHPFRRWHLAFRDQRPKLTTHRRRFDMANGTADIPQTTKGVNPPPPKQELAAGSGAVSANPFPTQPGSTSGAPGTTPVQGQQVTRDAPGGSLPAGLTSPEAAKSLPDPGVAMGKTAGVESPEQRDERVDAARPEEEASSFNNLKSPTREEMEKVGFTPLEEHPPLKEGDKIQGPHDRANRPPTDKELEHGRAAFAGVVDPVDQATLLSQQGEVKDPPIDKNAPKDVPADPRKVAESRGIKLKEKPDGEVR